ncbi:MAG: ferrous iron transport protein B [Campylobacterota bacterium]
MRQIKVALVGQPNVGKSMLTNALGNTKLKVGNFSGVTVEKKEISFIYRDFEFIFIDLPGAYSLNNFTIEEQVTNKFLQANEYDLILNVIDTTNMERNLYLTTELLELNQNMVIALNMVDEAEKEGVCIDDAQLCAILGKECVKTSALQKRGIDDLLEALVEAYLHPNIDSKLKFSDAIEEEIENIVALFKAKNFTHEASYRELAIKLLKEDELTFKQLHDNPIWLDLQPVLTKALEHIYLHYNTKDTDEIFYDERAAFAKGATAETFSCPIKTQKTLTQKIDDVMMHKLLGIPIFLFLMWGLFQLTFEIGSIPMDYIDMFFATLIDSTKSILGGGNLASVIADGAIAGVGAVVMFLPNIVILFLGIALLETTGYMSRVAFLLDGFFHKFGLHGKSFIPLVTGFGCSVPAYMAARTLKNRKDRLITLFIIGFMSCGARLPIYVLFIGAFFAQHNPGNILFIIYIAGAILGLIAAKVLKLTAFRGEDEPFVMEIPKYRMPSLKLIWHTVSLQAWSYLKKAGTFILAASILIWFGSNYPKDSAYNEKVQTQVQQLEDDQEIAQLESELSAYNLENSYLGMTGKAIEPIFAPIGYDWKMSVSLLTGLAAKEVVVSTLGILYGLGDEVSEESQTLIQKVRENIPFASAISFIIFTMIYLPCLAASVVFAKEAGGWKYLGYLFVMTTSVAWVLAFVGFTLTTALV